MAELAPIVAASNAPELTVSELSNALKRTIEDRFGFVRLRGEISNYKGPHSSGHAYFCLKDESARIDALIWKGTFLRLKIKPQEGLEVIATGKITTYPGKSSYQIVIEALEPAGVGALMALLEERRRKLAAEGLFDEARKQLLPFLPETIGVVTSPTGAVIRDILHRISERFPCHVIVWPVRVQGDTAAQEVASAITGFNALPEHGPLRRPDVLIVARGGGSLEDLWGFNEEIVVRAAAASIIPLISAIGHETDWTLLDYVADLRAPTPTAAAEKAVPVRAELLVNIADLGRRHFGAMLRYVQNQRTHLRSLSRALPRPDDVLAVPRQRLDRTSNALSGAITKRLDTNHLLLARAAHRLAQQSPHAKMARASQMIAAKGERLFRAFQTTQERRKQHLSFFDQRLANAFATNLRHERERQASQISQFKNIDQRLQRAFANRQSERTARLSSLTQMFDSLGYKKVLARGFALVKDQRGRIVHLAAQVENNASLSIQFSDGRKAVVAQGSPSTPREKVAPLSKPKATTGQGSLF
jgi:exodeoxyribonuclease VII large subunit